MINKIHNEDCLIGMQYITDKSIDMILCDLPYGTTQCKWDSVIPLDKLWVHYERIIKDNGAIVLTGSQPFTTDLINSNRKLFKYELIWEKSSPTGFLDAATRPLKCHENVIVFYKKQPTYNPQKWEIDPLFMDRRNLFTVIKDNSTVYGEHNDKAKKIDTGERFPLSVIPKKSHWSKGMHPTQKPFSLFEYLIKTYTNEGDLVLDNCSGSGTTAIACMNTSRKYICFEKDTTYFEQSQLRVKGHKSPLQLFI